MGQSSQLGSPLELVGSPSTSPSLSSLSPSMYFSSPSLSPTLRSTSSTESSPSSSHTAMPSARPSGERAVPLASTPTVSAPAVTPRELPSFSVSRHSRNSLSVSLMAYPFPQTSSNPSSSRSSPVSSPCRTPDVSTSASPPVSSSPSSHYSHPQLQSLSPSQPEPQPSSFSSHTTHTPSTSSPRPNRPKLAIATTIPSDPIAPPKNKFPTVANTCVKAPSSSSVESSPPSSSPRGRDLLRSSDPSTNSTDSSPKTFPLALGPQVVGHRLTIHPSNVLPPSRHAPTDRFRSVPSTAHRRDHSAGQASLISSTSSTSSWYFESISPSATVSEYHQAISDTPIDESSPTSLRSPTQQHRRTSSLPLRSGQSRSPDDLPIVPARPHDLPLGRNRSIQTLRTESRPSADLPSTSASASASASSSSCSSCSTHTSQTDDTGSTTLSSVHESSLAWDPASGVQSTIDPSTATTASSASSASRQTIRAGDQQTKHTDEQGHQIDNTTNDLSSDLEDESGKNKSTAKTEESEADRKKREASEAEERRKKSLLVHKLWDLVEGEVSYTEDLITLVHVYLHHLFQLSFFNPTRCASVARNTLDLLMIHKRFSKTLVTILSEEGLWIGKDGLVGDVDAPGMDLDRTTRRVAMAFIQEADHFTTYEDYCTGHETALAIIRLFENRPEWAEYERRCTDIAHRRPRPDLGSILVTSYPPLPEGQAGSKTDRPPLNPSYSSSNVTAGALTTSSAPVSPGLIPPSASLDRPYSKLMLRDLLIKPIQRICRYSLLLAGLRIKLGGLEGEQGDVAGAQTETGVSADGIYFGGDTLDRAVDVMKIAAGGVDEATRRKVAMERTRMIKNRIEPHVHLTRTIIEALDDCLFVGSLEVIYQPLPIMVSNRQTPPPLKVRYLAAFLYAGYLILAKVRKGRDYQAFHYMSLRGLRVVEEDIPGTFFLPYSFRLIGEGFYFELAAGHSKERTLWLDKIRFAQALGSPNATQLPCSIPEVMFPSRLPLRRASQGAGGPIGLSPLDRAFSSTLGLGGINSKRLSLTNADGFDLAASIESDVFDESTSNSVSTSPTMTTVPLPAFSHISTTPLSSSSSSPKAIISRALTSSSLSLSSHQTNQPVYLSHHHHHLQQLSYVQAQPLLRRNASYRAGVDKALGDVFSDSCAAARQLAQLDGNVLFPGTNPPTNIRSRVGASGGGNGGAGGDGHSGGPGMGINGSSGGGQDKERSSSIGSSVRRKMRDGSSMRRRSTYVETQSSVLNHSFGNTTFLDPLHPFGPVAGLPATVTCTAAGNNNIVNKANPSTNPSAIGQTGSSSFRTSNTAASILHRAKSDIALNKQKFLRRSTVFEVEEGSTEGVLPIVPPVPAIEPVSAGGRSRTRTRTTGSISRSGSANKLDFEGDDPTSVSTSMFPPVPTVPHGRQSSTGNEPSFPPNTPATPQTTGTNTSSGSSFRQMRSTLKRSSSIFEGWYQNAGFSSDSTPTASTLSPNHTGTGQKGLPQDGSITSSPSSMTLTLPPSPNKSTGSLLTKEKDKEREREGKDSFLRRSLSTISGKRRSKSYTSVSSLSPFTPAPFSVPTPLSKAEPVSIPSSSSTLGANGEVSGNETLLSLAPVSPLQIEIPVEFGGPGRQSLPGEPTITTSMMATKALADQTVTRPGHSRSSSSGLSSGGDSVVSVGSAKGSVSGASSDEGVDALVIPTRRRLNGVRFFPKSLQITPLPP